MKWNNKKLSGSTLSTFKYIKDAHKREHTCVQTQIPINQTHETNKILNSKTKAKWNCHLAIKITIWTSRKSINKVRKSERDRSNEIFRKVQTKLRKNSQKKQKEKSSIEVKELCRKVKSCKPSIKHIRMIKKRL